MEMTPLSITGAFEISNIVHGDERGEFVEWFRADRIKEQTGLDFSTIQANLSVSQRGTVRGIHFADVPPGQAKYVMCPTGSIRDYVVDIRVGSPTFGRWESVTITAKDRNAILLDVGLGHAFVALEEETTVTYLVTDHYKPQSEHAINPQDSDLALEFPFGEHELLISDKDRKAPSLADSLSRGRLPKWTVR
ncbi:dTDP-4-dehydrorhamnose 3,5-epimerase [Pontimonas sp.]|nr:dTDP-4-dehydrorhamnose 3,5-epimerase [Pontimonas sp.]